jgi:hypothetical protein
MEKQFIFHPESRIDQSPRDIGLQFAVAAEMAGRTDALALILESPFASIAEMAREIVPFLPSVGYSRTKVRYRDQSHDDQKPFACIAW